MAERMHRTQILLEPEQHEILSVLAKKEQRSISEIIRGILRHYLSDRSEEVRWERRSKALERIRQVRVAIQKERDGTPISLDVVAMIHEMRQQRAEQLISPLTEGSDEDRS